MGFVGFQELASQAETSFEGVAAPQRQRRRVWSSQNRLRRDMVGDHPIYQLFVNGSSTGSDKAFFCMICHRDVTMDWLRRPSLGVTSWETSLAVDRDVLGATQSACVKSANGPMELGEAQVEDYMNRPCKG